MGTWLLTDKDKDKAFRRIRVSVCSNWLSSVVCRAESAPTRHSFSSLLEFSLTNPQENPPKPPTTVCCTTTQ